MSARPKTPDHLGIFIRRHVIPQDMTVTEAAKKLGVGRPALSNLLNGNASLSHNMAVRLEKSFGVDRKTLLDIQASIDRFELQQEDKHITARTYVPNFLTIKARHIEEWAEKIIDSRHLLAVFLRKLIHSTGDELRHVDFPGYDNAQRRGWDGQLEADAATPWIPEGKSGWEFGTNKSPKDKADKDYANRMNSVSSADRAECTFVFVTPRNWPGKTKWVDAKKSERAWKDVRAYDASDLEQWLEESIPGQMWLAEQLEMQETGFETLNRCWERWESASAPKMAPEFFQPSIAANLENFKRWLGKPGEVPYRVAADSIDEGLAFLACLFQRVESSHENLAVVFKSSETLRKLVKSSSPFIPIVYTKEMERELATVYRKLHCIIVRPRNAVDSKPDIELEHLSHNSFEKALAAMGIADDRARQLARASGRSPTILRRRLSEIDAIRKPQWSADGRIARSLIPIAFVGAWHSKFDADCEVVSTLSDRPYEETERDISSLLECDDCPVWSMGNYRGVTSKIDALFAVSKHVIAKDLEEFFFLAEYVLSEVDPKLELPEDRRWAAGLYGKVRDHSTALRDGICETLVILCVHGNYLFQERIGIDLEGRVSALIRSLLTPLTLEKMLSHQRDLPHYAEAAPQLFLTLIEEDLRNTKPIVLDLLKPAEADIFSSPVRIGLLWALECLAWKHLGRVSLILAELSKTTISDNWSPKPIYSLRAAYKSWLPQTAAPIDERIEGLNAIASRFPDVAWRILMDQFHTVPEVVHGSYSPRWRSDASGANASATKKDCYVFRRRALDLALAWPTHNQQTLAGLARRLSLISAEDQETVWDLIETWADSETDERAKAWLREKIRVLAFTRRGRRGRRKVIDEARAKIACDKLQPHDPVPRYEWLFSQRIIEPSTDELEDESFDYSKYEEKIRVLRIKAIKEVWAEQEFEGVKALLSNSEAPDRVGISLAPNFISSDTVTTFLRQCLSVSGTLEKKVDMCIQGLLESIEDEVLDEVLLAAVDDVGANAAVRLFCNAPFKRRTWYLIGKFSGETQKKYWRNVIPQWGHDIDDDLNEVVDRLLEVQRPHIAFDTAQRNWDLIETSRLKRLMVAMGSQDRDTSVPYTFHVYSFSHALDSLDGRTGVSDVEMARFEFMFMDALEDSEHGIPNLERQIAKSPSDFVQILALAYERNDGEQDPIEWRVDDTARRRELVRAARSLLRRIGHIPGTKAGGKVNTHALIDWLTDVRRVCSEHGRREIGDQKIGELLSKARADDDGGWPCIRVCAAMESIASEEFSIGFKLGVMNRRGEILSAVIDAGAKERALAAEYRGWARQRAFDYPYVSSVLDRIADDYDQLAKMEETEDKVRSRLEL